MVEVKGKKEKSREENTPLFSNWNYQILWLFLFNLFLLRNKSEHSLVYFATAVQFKMVSMRSGKPICAPPRL